MSSLGRTLLSQQCLAHINKIKKPWLGVLSIQVQQERGVRHRQSTGMAGHVSPFIRIPFAHERGPGVGVDSNLQERLDKIFAQDPVLSERVDIGFKVTKDGSKAQEKMKMHDVIRKNRNNRELEKAAREGTLKVDLDTVRNEWETSGAALKDIFTAAELYAIYQDTFRHGYFNPCVVVNVEYWQDNSDVVVPVYRGNIVKPAEAQSAPKLSWQSGQSDLWTMVMTGLDSHFTQDNSEYLHWMVTNIRGCDLTSGDEICNYMQPFPPFGTGYHRYVFILYKQNQELDLKNFNVIEGDIDLDERTFSTFDFYTKHQDSLTPAGLAFFQSDYDTSLRPFFHDVLNMKEPKYEYEFPKPHIRPWDNFYYKNNSKGFNEFMDRHRDPKDIQKEVLEKKLAHTHPFIGDTEGYLQFPAAHESELLEIFPAPVGQKFLNWRQSYKIPQWKRNRIQRERRKEGYFGSTVHKDLRRDPTWSS